VSDRFYNIGIHLGKVIHRNKDCLEKKLSALERHRKPLVFNLYCIIHRVARTLINLCGVHVIISTVLGMLPSQMPISKELSELLLAW
jgi:hypothetical protein